MIAIVHVYKVEFCGHVDYVRSSSSARAKWYVMQRARAAGYWKPGQSLAGLRCSGIWTTFDDPKVEHIR